MKAKFKNLKLSKSQILEIAELEVLGWVIGEHTEYNGHNGEEWYNIEYKSPRMISHKHLGCISHTTEMSNWSLKQMLFTAEAYALAEQVVAWEESNIIKYYVSVMKARFLKDQTLNFTTAKVELPSYESED